jgi:catechol 2,3-dioxygenase-like lactoylglutathione lyase family enzyme
LTTSRPQPEFFVKLGLELRGEGTVGGRWMDRIVGAQRHPVRDRDAADPDGNGQLELGKFHSPPAQGDNRHAPENTLGTRHIAFAVEDIDAVVAGLRARGVELERYEDRYRLCYVRGPEGRPRLALGHRAADLGITPDRGRERSGCQARRVRPNRTAFEPR